MHNLFGRCNIFEYNIFLWLVTVDFLNQTAFSRCTRPKIEVSGFLEHDKYALKNFSVIFYGRTCGSRNLSPAGVTSVTPQWRDIFVSTNSLGRPMTKESHILSAGICIPHNGLTVSPLSFSSSSTHARSYLGLRRRRLQALQDDGCRHDREASLNRAPHYLNKSNLAVGVYKCLVFPQNDFKDRRKKRREGGGSFYRLCLLSFQPITLRERRRSPK